jgi:glycosyltransferase involved in cell wall biosynthesis
VTPSETRLGQAKERLEEMVWIGSALIRRKFLAILEGIFALCTVSRQSQQFYVVSCERNAGPSALKCLDSVYRQRYSRHLIRHIFIDDASNDGTHELVLDWLRSHPDHTVAYIHQDTRQGGTANTLQGFRLAPDDAIVIELNGDDWLADNGVFPFLNRVYASTDVWMTNNTLRYDNGLPALWARPFPREVIENNGYRDLGEWISSAPHTFRKRLFNHLREDTFLDPETGDYWESADDQAIYLAMLELAGHHALHLHRVLYVYNFRESSHCFHGADLSEGRARRIRQLPRYSLLETL